STSSRMAWATRAASATPRASAGTASATAAGAGGGGASAGAGGGGGGGGGRCWPVGAMETSGASGMRCGLLGRGWPDELVEDGVDGCRHLLGRGRAAGVAGSPRLSSESAVGGDRRQGLRRQASTQRGGVRWIGHVDALASQPRGGDREEPARGERRQGREVR